MRYRLSAPRSCTWQSIDTGFSPIREWVREEGLPWQRRGIQQQTADVRVYATRSGWKIFGKTAEKAGKKADVSSIDILAV
ncbi:hypothetical protein L596_013688 [Steinernema carpocapsae]|uniref:Uncharacterized protein n=1 Tax=Steinernema carpocapsae TaxID=34508 RepID=A0A4V6A560_STECR|nr:hypothetical protein L596_013688 [Steinernema carpocapsae]